MRLKLESIEKRVGAEQHLYPFSMDLQPNTINVLLGATLSGKTTLMRLMAGLEPPSAGKLFVDDQDVTGLTVRNRDVAMVYQQFINYPSMTVFDNIASPLRLRREKNIDAQVKALAAKLHIDPFLKRLPTELSGGQQQRVALARALAKRAPLILLDEPLVNLDYKLREELRDELGHIFANSESTVVYATTEPGEALLLGGLTAVLDQGRLLQYGPTPRVFHRPDSLQVARAFSDPPMNLITARVGSDGRHVKLNDTLQLDLRTAQTPAAAMTVGLRANALRVHARPGDCCLTGLVELAEISGSDTFLHVKTSVGNVVAQLTGVHYFEIGLTVNLYLNAEHAYVFDEYGALKVYPQDHPSFVKSGE
jgi:glycerol transport system ATP-binding protein